MVPIVGRDLLTVRGQGREVFLYPLLAARLAEYLEVPGDDLPPGGELNAVACRFLERGHGVEDLYPALKTIMPRGDELTVPEPLLRLAEIRHFELYVSTTFDSLLERALDQLRFDGAARTRIITYAPNAVEDLPEDSQPGTPVVYHLLGRLSAVPAYAVTQEDTLEFVHSLQSETRQPHLLFDELRRRSLLILGSSFGGWLARFFLRTAKGQRLPAVRGTDYVADAAISSDPDQVLFLRHFSSRTKVFRSGGAVEFVAELHRRWKERHPPAEIAAAAETDAAPPAAAEIEAGAVFLSYASEDHEAVEKIKEALENAGVDVFFDRDDLRPGDDFEARLLHCISECSLFVPMISRNTLTRRRRFFRLEWDKALSEARKVAPFETFIVPVVIDDTPPDDPAIPEKFRDLHWGRLPGGETSPEFVGHVRDLFRRYQKLLAGAA